eukprot:6828664-Ditylum_brightwellii.AAC.1
MVLMLSTAARAFVVSRAPLRVAGAMGTSHQPKVNLPSFTRLMMSSQAPDESIVDICKGKISAALGTEDVVVTGAYDDPNGSHISIKVVSDKFEGKRMVQRQQLVYKALWEELKGPVHAVDSMICKTPSEE